MPLQQWQQNVLHPVQRRQRHPRPLRPVSELYPATVQEAAAYLNVSKDVIRRNIRDGWYPHAVKVAGGTQRKWFVVRKCCLDGTCQMRAS